MKQTSGNKYKPEPSRYQKSLRRTTIQLVLLFSVLAVAVAALFYYFERKNLIP
jgi:hypothetical protein